VEQRHPERFARQVGDNIVSGSVALDAIHAWLIYSGTASGARST
jgi:hypothetical protein